MLVKVEIWFDILILLKVFIFEIYKLYDFKLN